MYGSRMRGLFPTKFLSQMLPWRKSILYDKVVSAMGYTKDITYRTIHAGMQRAHHLRWDGRLQIANRLLNLLTEKSSPPVKQWAEPLMLLSDSSIWALQCGNRCYGVIKGVRKSSGFINRVGTLSNLTLSSVTFDAVVQTIRTAHRVAHFMQQGHARVLEKDKLRSAIDEFSHRAFEKFPRVFLMTYVVADQLNTDYMVMANLSYRNAYFYFPIGKSIMRNIARRLNFTMPDRMNVIGRLMSDKFSNFSSRYHWLTDKSKTLWNVAKVAYLLFFGWKVYESYQFHQQCRLIEQHMEQNKFDEAHELLSQIPDKTVAISVTKAIVLLHKNEPEPKCAIDLANSIFDKLMRHQSDDPDQHLNFVISLSIRLVREKQLPFKQRLDLLRKAEDCSSILSVRDLTKVDPILIHLNVIQHFLLLVNEQDEGLRREYDLFSFIAKKLDSFVLEHAFNKIAYLANAIAGRNYFAQHWRAEQSEGHDQSAKRHLETALKIFENSIVEANPDEQDHSSDEGIIYILQQLAILAAEKNAWRDALEFYEKMDNYTVPDEMKIKIDDEKANLRRLIEFQSRSQSVIVPRVIGIFYHPDQNILTPSQDAAPGTLEMLSEITNQTRIEFTS